MTNSVLMRYAVVGTLLRARRPLTIAELSRHLLERRPLDRIVGPLWPKRMSDMLRSQAAAGRVRRVARGTYVALPDRMSRTTRWRYRHWERSFDEVVRRRAANEAAPHVGPAHVSAHAELGEAGPPESVAAARAHRCSSSRCSSSQHGSVERNSE